VSGVVVCVIADPARAPLDEALADAFGRELGSCPRWLAEAEACEFALANGVSAAAAARIAALVGAAPLDVAIVPAQPRVKRLLVSDMDSTMITIECIDELADAVGIRTEVAAITRRAMNGEMDFRTALEARVALLAGLPVAVFEDIYRERLRYMPGARTLIQTMRARGALTALVSGGFVPFTDRVRAALGFDLAQANRLEIKGNRVTGRLLPPIREPRSKLVMLQRLARARGLSCDETLAVGDGANDLPMLGAAGLGVAFRAHPKVAANVAVAIRVGDLTALLYLQGIAKRDFVLT
jgi:phosphoserine phosphatase